MSYNSNLTCPCTNLFLNTPTDLNLLLKSFNNDKVSPFVDSDPYDSDPNSNVNFKYYDIHDFHKLNSSTLKSNKHKFISLFHTNICSLTANIGKVEQLLHDIDFDFDIIALSETHNPDNKKHLFSPEIIENYHPYKGTTGTTSNSGTGFYIHKDINPLPRPDLEFKLFKDGEEFESSWIEIVNDKSPNIIIGTIYRHPTENDKLFIKKLRSTLSLLSKEKNKIFAITGDFNYDLLKYGSDIKVENFLNTMVENQFQACITEPTRIVEGNRPTLIDNIFVKNVVEPISGNFLDKISYDHLPNFAIFEAVKPAHSKKFIQIRDLSQFNQENFHEDLFSLNLQNHQHLTTNEMTQLFHKNFMKAYNKHASLKKTNGNYNWITGTIAQTRKPIRTSSQPSTYNPSLYM